MTKSTTALQNQEERASSKLYRVYWKLYLTDLCEKLDIYPSERMRRQLHKEFKEYLGYKSTAGMTEEQMSLFLYEVLAAAASELGIFIRSSLKQPKDIQEMPLQDSWKYL